MLLSFLTLCINLLFLGDDKTIISDRNAKNDSKIEM